MMNSLLAYVALAFAPAPSSAMCSITGLPDSGFSPAMNTAVVARAAVIVRASALRDEPGQVIVFRPIEWIRGDSSIKEVRILGQFVDVDDFNRLPVPYAWLRSAGQRGDCFAREYRRGAEYLLLLLKTTAGFTSTWAHLAPVNEQVKGADDAWVVWVRAKGTPR